MEAVAALGILMVVMVVVAQTGVWGMRERARSASHQSAVELAHNIMEAARARAPQDLTPAWAAQQKLPKEWNDQFHTAKLMVRVEPEKSLPSAKRVTVELHWGHEPIPGSLQLVSVFSSRTAQGGRR